MDAPMSLEHSPARDGKHTLREEMLGGAVAVVPVGPLKPALSSINDACRYMGGVSRAKFYADLLPRLETVKLGGRNLVVVASMDRLIEGSKTQTASVESTT
jgi:hypothetical protein